MIKGNFKTMFYFLLAFFLLTGCSRNDTRYFADAEDQGIAIFSSTGNNLLSCFIDGKPWRTVSRTTGSFTYYRTNYEVDIFKQVTGTLKDTLVISWMGYFEGNTIMTNSFSLHLAVEPGFGYKDLNLLQGQRLTIDTAFNYFSLTVNGFNSKGTGHIYFHSIRLDSMGLGMYSGSMSGLLDADFNTSKITRGRFDHWIVPDEVHF